jgi:hypothetical protein
MPFPLWFSKVCGEANTMKVAKFVLRHEFWFRTNMKVPGAERLQTGTALYSMRWRIENREVVEREMEVDNGESTYG